MGGAVWRQKRNAFSVRIPKKVGVTGKYFLFIVYFKGALNKVGFKVEKIANLV